MVHPAGRESCRNRRARQAEGRAAHYGSDGPASSSRLATSCSRRRQGSRLCRSITAAAGRDAGHLCGHGAGDAHPGRGRVSQQHVKAQLTALAVSSAERSKVLSRAADHRGNYPGFESEYVGGGDCSRCGARRRRLSGCHSTLVNYCRNPGPRALRIPEVRPRRRHARSAEPGWLRSEQSKWGRIIRDPEHHGGMTMTERRIRRPHEHLKALRGRGIADQGRAPDQQGHRDDIRWCAGSSAAASLRGPQGVSVYEM